MMTHQYLTDSLIVRDDGATIPTDPANADYAALLASGEPIAPRRVPELEAVKRAAITEIEQQAGSLRTRYVTDAPGMDLLYGRKRREAVAVLDDPEPGPEKYPILASSIGIEVPDTGDRMTDFGAIASIVVARELALAKIGKPIEEVRLAAKKAVAKAQTADDVALVLAGIEWPK